MLIGRNRFGYIPKPSVDTVRGTGMGSQARSELIAILAGNARNMFEGASGGAVSDGHPICAPITPHSGTAGHDHSGGRYGELIQRSLMVAVYGNLRAQLEADDVYFGTACSLDVYEPPLVGTEIEEGVILHSDFEPWIPNCADDGGYTQGYLEFAIGCTGDARVSGRVISHGFSNPIIEQVCNVEHTYVMGGMIPLRPGSCSPLNIKLTGRYHNGDATLYVKAIMLHVGGTP